MTKIKSYITGIATLGVLIDIFLIKGSYEYIVVSVFFMCIFSVRLANLGLKFMVTVILTTFTFMIFLYIFGFKEIAEKTAVWVFLFISIYAFQQLKLLR